MSRMIRNLGIGEFFNMMGSAINTAAAVEAGRQPRPRDLHRLGIDPKWLNRAKS